MRRVFACLLALGLVSAGSAHARERPRAFHGPAVHHLAGPGHLHSPGFDRLRRHGLERRALGLDRRFASRGGLPYGFFPRSYVVGEPRTTIIERQAAAAPEIVEPTIPTVLGIRAAPVGQPTLYVLEDGRRPLRPGPQVVELDRPGMRPVGNGPRVVHLRVPRDRPRGYR